jgi:hypothetical protein
VTVAEVVNLRQARKQKARADKDAEASQNRALFGRTKAAKLKDAAEKGRAEKHLEGHRREE